MECPVPVVFDRVCVRSPPAVMNRYIRRDDAAERFAKIDNDVMLPPEWLDALLEVVADEPELDMLGTEAFRTVDPTRLEEWNGCYSAEPARHIGGVGLFRTDAFRRKPPMRENSGRNGLTHFQYEYDLRIGWIAPDLLVSCLDMVPLEPYRTLTDEYIRRKWARRWPEYDPACDSYYAWWQE